MSSVRLGRVGRPGRTACILCAPIRRPCVVARLAAARAPSRRSALAPARRRRPTMQKPVPCNIELWRVGPAACLRRACGSSGATPSVAGNDPVPAVDGLALVISLFMPCNSEVGGRLHSAAVARRGAPRLLRQGVARPPRWSTSLCQAGKAGPSPVPQSIRVPSYLLPRGAIEVIRCGQ